MNEKEDVVWIIFVWKPLRFSLANNCCNLFIKNQKKTHKTLAIRLTFSNSNDFMLKMMEYTQLISLEILLKRFGYRFHTELTSYMIVASFCIWNV